jgi:hypothetical protein
LGWAPQFINRFLKFVLLILQLSNALCQVPVHVMIIDGMVVIEQIIEFRAAAVLTLNAEETFHAIHVQSPSLLMIFSGGHYTELNYSVSFWKE